MGSSDLQWLLLLKCCLSNEPGHRISCTELLTSPYFAHQGFAEKYEEELKVITAGPGTRYRPGRDPSVIH